MLGERDAAIMVHTGATLAVRAVSHILGRMVDTTVHDASWAGTLSAAAAASLLE